jgi:hypothetical protein
LERDFGYADRKELLHLVGLMSVNNANLTLKEGRGTGKKKKELAEVYTITSSGFRNEFVPDVL